MDDNNRPSTRGSTDVDTPNDTTPASARRDPASESSQVEGDHASHYVQVNQATMNNLLGSMRSLHRRMDYVVDMVERQPGEILQQIRNGTWVTLFQGPTDQPPTSRTQQTNTRQGTQNATPRDKAQQSNTGSHAQENTQLGDAQHRNNPQQDSTPAARQTQSSAPVSHSQVERAAANPPQPSQTLPSDAMLDHMRRIHALFTADSNPASPIERSRFPGIQDIFRNMQGWSGSWPQVVVPADLHQEWQGGFTLGFDRPLQGRAGSWHFFTTGNAPGSDEREARDRLGGEPTYFPNNPAPNAAEVYSMRRHQRDVRGRVLEETYGIDVVWVPYHPSAEANGQPANHEKNQPPKTPKSNPNGTTSEATDGSDLSNRQISDHRHDAELAKSQGKQKGPKAAPQVSQSHEPDVLENAAPSGKLPFTDSQHETGSSSSDASDAPTIGKLSKLPMPRKELKAGREWVDHADRWYEGIITTKGFQDSQQARMDEARRALLHPSTSGRQTRSGSVYPIGTGADASESRRSSRNSSVASDVRKRDAKATGKGLDTVAEVFDEGSDQDSKAGGHKKRKRQNPGPSDLVRKPAHKNAGVTKTTMGSAVLDLVPYHKTTSPTAQESGVAEDGPPTILRRHTAHDIGKPMRSKTRARKTSPKTAGKKRARSLQLQALQAQTMQARRDSNAATTEQASDMSDDQQQSSSPSAELRKRNNSRSSSLASSSGRKDKTVDQMTTGLDEPSGRKLSRLEEHEKSMEGKKIPGLHDWQPKQRPSSTRNGLSDVPPKTHSASGLRQAQQGDNEPSSTGSAKRGTPSTTEERSRKRLKLHNSRHASADTSPGREAEGRDSSATGALDDDEDNADEEEVDRDDVPEDEDEDEEDDLSEPDGADFGDDELARQDALEDEIAEMERKERENGGR